jgi:hypothetical protein
LVRCYAVLKLALPNGCGKIPTLKTFDVIGEKYFAHTCVRSIANNDYTNNLPNRMKIPRHNPIVVIREYVIMSNHVHGIVQIVDAMDGCDDWDCRGENFFAPTYAPTIVPTYAPSDEQMVIRGTSRTIGSILRGFKIGVTK